MDIAAFKWKTTIAEALGWELYKKSLNQELTDQAEQCADVEIPGHAEMDTTARIAIDGPFFITSCTKGTKNCELTPSCTIKEPLARVNDTIAGVLKSISIQDLAEHEHQTEHVREAQKLVSLTV